MEIKVGQIVNLPHRPRVAAIVTKIRKDTNGEPLIDLETGDGSPFVARECELEELTPAQRQIRMNVRNFLLVATIEELETELRISNKTNDNLRAVCVKQLLTKAIAEETEAGYDKLASGWVG